jgi:hypothetical protein
MCLLAVGIERAGNGSDGDDDESIERGDRRKPRESDARRGIE